MSVTNEQRHELYKRLDEVLGREEATTMMDYLPPVGWADVATRKDLDTHTELLRAEMREFRLELTSDFNLLRVEMHKGHAEMHKSQRHLAFTLIGAFTALQAILFAATTLTS